MTDHANGPTAHCLQRGISSWEGARPVLGRRAFFGSAMGVGAMVLSACSSQSGEVSVAEASVQPKRVVALSTGHLDNCLALGIVPVGLAVARSEATGGTGIPNFLSEEFGDRFDLDGIEIVGERGSPDMEKVAALEPDLILSNDRSPKKLNDEFAQIATTVNTHGGSENFKDDLSIVGKALKKQDEADRLLADYQKRAEDWGASRSGAAGSASGGGRESVSLARARGDEYLYFGSRALAGIVAEDAGLTRPKLQQFDDKPSRGLSLERINALDADWLFYAFPDGGGQLTDAQLWKKLPVVAKGHAFEVDVDPWFLNASVVAANRVLTDMKKFLA